MNKQELIIEIQNMAIHYKDSGVSKVTVEAVLNGLVNAITSALMQGDEVVLPGIGKFSVELRAARKGRNPSTGAEIDIPAKRVTKFSAAKALKDAVAQEA